MSEGRRAWFRAALALTVSALGVDPALAARPRARKQPHRAVAKRTPPRHPAHASSVSRRTPASLPAASRPVVVIDPGHGGADPGAIGRSGTLEKTVTLRTALALEKLLEATGRYRVRLTRRDDRFVPLAERAAFGPAHDAALVVSIHADSSPDHRARGASVYVRSGGASGTGLKRVASGVGNSTGIAQALATGKTAPASRPWPRPGSAWLQYLMIDNLDDDIRMTAAPARAAHLWVLANTDIPGVLVEMGFLSNKQDERLLRNPWHRLLVARSLRDAVNDYFSGLAAGAPSRT